MIARFVSSVLALAFSVSAASAQAKKPVLLVLTNQSAMGETKRTTGFFLSEASHPWEVFRNAGHAVVLASPEGGAAPLDVRSHDLKDPVNKAFWEEHGVGQPQRHDLRVEETLPLAKVNAREYVAVFFAGGHGTMWDFRDHKEVQRVAEEVYRHGGVVAAVCHGSAALIHVKLADGNPLVKGKRVAAFTNEEEKSVRLDKVVPFSLQTELENAGALVEAGPNFKENAIRDGRLVTGQNPASARKTAELVLEALAR